MHWICTTVEPLLWTYLQYMDTDSWSEEYTNIAYQTSVNPLSPNIHTQILQTDIYLFP